MSNNKTMLVIAGPIAAAVVFIIVLSTVNVYPTPTPMPTPTSLQGQQVQQQQYDEQKITKIISLGVRGFDFDSITHEAQLIINGKVLNKKSAGQIGESSPGVPDSLTHIPGTNNLIQVDSVIKGDPALVGQTIQVITEGDSTASGRTDIKVEDTVTLQKNEKAVFFLIKEPVYDNQWTILGMDQGKCKVKSPTDVQCNFAGGTIKGSEAGLESKIKQTMKEPKEKAKNLMPGSEDIKDQDQDLGVPGMRQGIEAPPS